jgi:hypothetical protein
MIYFRQHNVLYSQQLSDYAALIGPTVLRAGGQLSAVEASAGFASGRDTGELFWEF